MKTRLLGKPVALSLALGLAASVAFAADPDIKVTSTVYPDKSHTDMQSNLTEGTAESKTYDAAGKLTQRMSYKLDEKGQPTEGTAYSAKGMALFRFSYTRDSAGRVTEELNNDPSGKLVRRLVYRYDSNGRVAGIDTFDANGQLISGSGPKKAPKKRTR